MVNFIPLLCVIFFFTACQTDQDALYSEAISQIEAEATAEPSIDPNDPGYLGLGTPAPEDRATPIPGDDLSGELTIQGIHRSIGNPMYKPWQMNFENCIPK